MNRLREILRDERGELEEIPGWIILVTGTVTLLLLLVFVGRGVSTANTVQAAANAAARDASLSRTAEVAVPNAQDVARATLDGGVNCIASTIDITGNGLTTGLGETGTVTASVSCTISTADILIPGVPGEITITRTATSPVDPYRAR